MAEMPIWQESFREDPPASPAAASRRHGRPPRRLEELRKGQVAALDRLRKLEQETAARLAGIDTALPSEVRRERAKAMRRAAETQARATVRQALDRERAAKRQRHQYRRALRGSDVEPRHVRATVAEIDALTLEIVALWREIASGRPGSVGETGTKSTGPNPPGPRTVPRRVRVERRNRFS